MDEGLGIEVATYGFRVARAWRVCYWGLAARCSRCIKETTALPASCQLSLPPCTHTVRNALAEPILTCSTAPVDFKVIFMAEQYILTVVGGFFSLEVDGYR
jgi:hypothetical protein